MTNNIFNLPIVAPNISKTNLSDIQSLQSKINNEISTAVNNMINTLNNIESAHNNNKNNYTTQINNKANTSHNHVIADITDFSTAISEKALATHSHGSTYATSSHNHGDTYLKWTNVNSTSTTTHGPNESKIPYIKSDGVMEVSRYIDMHLVGNSVDYGCRLNYSNTSGLNISTPMHATGSISATSLNLTAANIGTNFKGKIRDVFYPIGSIYQSYDSTSPATLFGGSWSQITDRFLGSVHTTSYTWGSSSELCGENTVALETYDVPEHTHNYEDYYFYASSRNGYPDDYDDVCNSNHWTHHYWYGNEKANDSYTLSDTTGSSSPHNNMPQYMTIYAWKRTG